MDVVKIQAEAIKSLIEYNRAMYFIKGSTAYLSIDGAEVFVIPADMFWLNLKREPVKAIPKLFENFEKSKRLEAKRTDIMKYTDKKNGTAIKYKTDEYDVWFAERRLKRYGKLEKLKIMATGELRPAGIYDEGNNLLGILSPMRITEN